MSPRRIRMSTRTSCRPTQLSERWAGSASATAMAVATIDMSLTPLKLRTSQRYARCRGRPRIVPGTTATAAIRTRGRIFSSVLGVRIDISSRHWAPAFSPHRDPEKCAREPFRRPSSTLQRQATGHRSCWLAQERRIAPTVGLSLADDCRVADALVGEASDTAAVEQRPGPSVGSTTRTVTSISAPSAPGAPSSGITSGEYFRRVWSIEPMESSAGADVERNSCPGRSPPTRWVRSKIAARTLRDPDEGKDRVLVELLDDFFEGKVALHALEEGAEVDAGDAGCRVARPASAIVAQTWLPRRADALSSSKRFHSTSMRSSPRTRKAKCWKARRISRSRRS